MKQNCVGGSVMSSQKALIVVEGKADKRFLEEYLAHLGYPDNLYTIHISGGWTNWETAPQALEDAEANGLLTALIYDGDSDPSLRRNQLQDKLSHYRSKARIFLLPNNCDGGCLEDLLTHLVPPKYQPIIQCWNNFITSLSGLIPPLVPETNLPGSKTKFYSYASLLRRRKEEEKDAAEAYRTYQGVEHWDLNTPYLDPLKSFLEDLLK